MWDIAANRLLRSFTNTQAFDSWQTHARLGACVFSPDGHRLLGYHDYQARAWDVDSGKQLYELRFDRTLTGIHASPDGRLLVSASVDGLVQTWSAANGSRQATFHSRQHLTVTENQLGAITSNGA